MKTEFNERFLNPTWGWLADEQEVEYDRLDIYFLMFVQCSEDLRSIQEMSIVQDPTR